MLHIVYVFADSPSEWNCSQWRCLSVADILNRSGKHTAKLIYINSFADYHSNAMQDLIGAANVIVVQRNIIHPAIWEAIDYWRVMRKPIIADLDDDYPNLPWSNPAHEFWIANSQNLPESPIALLTQGLQRCDALSSPSRVILDDWQKAIGIHGVWVPNWAQGNWYLNLPPRPKHSKIVIGWGGSVSHYDSWLFSGAKEAIEELCAENENIGLLICGNDPRLRNLFKIAPEQLQFKEGVPPQEWGKVVAQFDIGLAPLDMREGYHSYDNHRSWIKALEYLLCGVPWIASKSTVYEDFEQYGKCIENTKEEWLATLRATIANVEFLQRQAKRNQKVGWANTLEANVDRLVEKYERVAMATQVQMPATFYVNWTADDKQLRERREQARTNVAKMPLPPPRDAAFLDSVQNAAMLAATNIIPAVEWYGVNLTECMQYDLMQQYNRWLLGNNAVPAQP